MSLLSSLLSTFFSPNLSFTFAVFLVTMGNVNVKVEAILGLMMESDLNISQVLQPPPGHCLESLRSVVNAREVLGTDGPVARG